MLKEKIRAQILGGALQDQKAYLAGNCGGYMMIIDLPSPYVTPAMYMVRINAGSQADPGNANLLIYLQQQKLANKMINDVSVSGNSLTIALRSPNLIKKLPAVINEAVGPVLQWLQTYNYVTGCCSCGSTNMPVNCYEINGGHHLMCDTCAAEVNNSLAANQREIKAVKSKFIPGLVGAFLGSLIGCILWVLINQLGYIAGIAGLVTGICAFKGYEMLGGHLDKKGVICSVIVMFLMIYLANKFSWALAAYSELKEYDWTFSECFRGLSYILEESDLKGSYFGDMAIGFFLTLLSSFGTILGALKSSGGSYTMKKM